MSYSNIKKSIVFAAALMFCASSLQAAAYKIPEQSVRSLALSAAYVAGANSADASYFNPANMSWLDNNAMFEVGSTYIHLPKVDFKGSVASVPADAESKTENFLLPIFHYVGYSNKPWRFGLSVVVPGGLSKRWDSEIQKMKAEEFTLKIVEVNPTISYMITPYLSIGGGVRALYSDGKVKAYLNGAYAQNMTGDTFEYGYNLAISYKATQNSTLSATYRSKIDLSLKGESKGFISVGSTQLPYYYTPGGVSVPLPATFIFAASHDFDRIKVELLFERTRWSSYEKLDFNFDSEAVENFFGDPIDKKWVDTNTFRIGVTHRYNDKWMFMFGYAYDETPVPETTLGFELPDSDAHIYSCGAIMNLNENMELGFGLLAVSKIKRYVDTPANENGIDGEFSKGGAFLASLSLGYRF